MLPGTEVFIHCFLLSFVIGLFTALLFRYKIIFRERSNNVCIVVLGDVGHSPRMQYHASSFLAMGYDIRIIGYAGSNPIPELQNNPRVRIVYLSPPYDLKDKLNSSVAYIIKSVHQALNLLFTLLNSCDSSLLILQNPPAIPTIPVCWFYCRLVRIKFGIDWHNYTCSIMALKLGRSSVVVKIAAFIEFLWGARAYFNFCVTEAMQQDLKKEWNIKAEVLYDRPKEEFRPISIQKKHALLEKLSKTFLALSLGDAENSNAFTELLSDGNIEWRSNRPGLIVSSTSWTEDEDFSILLDALQEYEAVKSKDKKLPNLVCIITGKGPLKEFYSSIINLKQWNHVRFVMPWLDHSNYAELLACADLGICLHTSSSGLDLPMKVIDMFGCGLPVCAFKFKCLGELIKHEENSFVFSNTSELAKQILSWFDDFPNNQQQQEQNKLFKENLKSFQELKWHENWINVVIPTTNQM